MLALFDAFLAILIHIYWYWYIFFHFLKTKFLVILNFALKTAKIAKIILKTPEIIKVSYFLSQSIIQKLLFDVDLFPQTFDMKSPIGSNKPEQVFLLNEFWTQQH